MKRNPESSTAATTAHKRNSAVGRLLGSLHPGRVYRREDLAGKSNAVDRHLRQLVKEGHVRKLNQGLYHVPRKSAFGPLPPEDKSLVQAFLKDDDFLLFSPNSYNSLGLGTTQLYNRTVVYNHKRHGTFTLGNRTLDFRMKHKFPKKVTPEFLFVDLLNNLEELAEDKEMVLKEAKQKMAFMDRQKLQRAVKEYGSAFTKKRFESWTNA